MQRVNLKIMGMVREVIPRTNILSDLSGGGILIDSQIPVVRF